MIVLLVSSCAIYPTSSKLSDSFILGENIKEVINRTGTPFSRDSYMKDNVKVDVLYYKELANVDVYPYIITTTLIFENEKLIKVTQNDKFISNNVISVDSIHK